MEKYKIKLILAFILTSVIVVLLLHAFTGSFIKGYPRYRAFVIKVIDGDTLTTADGEKVRLLGINTPEKGHRYYEEAKQALRELVENKTVELEIDVVEKDKYGRSLRYIFLGDIFVNLEMVKKGYANTYTLPPNVRYESNLQTAQEFAKENKLGIWVPSNFSGCIFIQDFTFTGEELIEFKSTCGAMNMSNWYVKDEANHMYYFPSISVEKIKLHTGYGKDNSTDLFWNTSSVWNDDSDTVFLYDQYGLLVLSYGY
jgi:endonuclease YncB( thermonuclease family)